MLFLLWPHFCTVLVNPLPAAHALDYVMDLVPLLSLQNQPAILYVWYVWYIVHSAVSYPKVWRSFISPKKLSSSTSTWFTISFLTSGRSAVHFNIGLCCIAFMLVPSICLLLVAYRTLQVSLAQVETHIPMICNQYCLSSSCPTWFNIWFTTSSGRSTIHLNFCLYLHTFMLVPSVCPFMVAYGTL